VTTQPAYTSSPASVAGVAAPIARKGGVRIKDVVKRYGTQDAGVLAVDHCTFDVPAARLRSSLAHQAAARQLCSMPSRVFIA